MFQISAHWKLKHPWRHFSIEFASEVDCISAYIARALGLHSLITANRGISFEIFCGAFKILNGIFVSFEFQRMRQHNYNLSLLLWMNFFKFMIACDGARRRQRRSERSWVCSTMKQLIPQNKKSRGTWSERRLARAAKKKRGDQKNISCLECVNKSVIFSGIRNL